MQYTVVSEVEAKGIRNGATPQWKVELRGGKMLLMDKRPNWTKEEREQTGMSLRTKTAPDGKVYVWLQTWVSPLRELSGDDYGREDPRFPQEDPLDLVTSRA